MLAQGLFEEMDRLTASADILGKSNSRLQKQGHEKDEMNNSTMTEVMRLKQLEQVGKTEKDKMELKMKEADQVVVAARLAGANAKKIEEALAAERREREAERKGLMEEFRKVSEDKLRLEGTVQEMQGVEGGGAKGREDLKVRLDEMTEKVGELKRVNGEYKDQSKLMGAENEKMKGMVDGSKGGSSGYTVEQLELQIKTYKNKIMCNVCNEREKQVMLTRCCHTFCKPCIDQRIEGRGRNCPSCNDKFDKKEVTRMFLTG